MPNWIKITPKTVDKVKGWVAKAPPGTFVAFSKAGKRSTEQNARMWAMLTDISKQVDWYGQKLTPEDFKDIISAGLRRERVVPNMEGNGYVALGLRTSQMNKSEIADLFILIQKFGDERGVKFTDEA